MYVYIYISTTIEKKKGTPTLSIFYSHWFEYKKKTVNQKKKDFAYQVKSISDKNMSEHYFYLHLSNWSLYILLMICETIGSRPRQSICKYRLQDPCAKLHSFSHIMIEVPFFFYSI